MAQNELTTSHLIVHVADTDATIDFWCKGLGGELEQDEEMAAPALDKIFGRQGVRIRDTFIRCGGTRLHTIETLDVPRTRESPPEVGIPLGLGGVSFRVADLDASHARIGALGGVYPTNPFPSRHRCDHPPKVADPL